MSSNIVVHKHLFWLSSSVKFSC